MTRRPQNYPPELRERARSEPLPTWWMGMWKASGGFPMGMVVISPASWQPPVRRMTVAAAVGKTSRSSDLVLQRQLRVTVVVADRGVGRGRTGPRVVAGAQDGRSARVLRSATTTSSSPATRTHTSAPTGPGGVE